MSDPLRIDQQRQWRQGRRVGVATYVERHPELAVDPSALAALIHGEIELRREAGESPRIDEYVVSYPQCAAELARLLAGVGPSLPLPSGGFETIVPGLSSSVGAADAPPEPREATSYETVVGERLPDRQVPSGTSPNRAASDQSSAVGTPPVATSLSSVPPVAGDASGATVVGGTVVGGVAVGGTNDGGMPDGATVVGELERRPTRAGSRESDEAEQRPAPGAAAALVLNVSRPEIPGYKILNELGRGGMGVVYKARQLSADRVVALKVVRNDVLDALPLDTRASTLDRFRHEAQAAAHLEHDNLVTVYEVGEVGGVCYYAMRYVEGRSLHDALKQGPLEQRAAARYLEPVARALHMAHQKGILHRDLKPHNIMVDGRTDRPLLADFGLAKFTQSSNELTHAGELLGTPSYMSPEQACDAAGVTALADVYSLGATLYHLVTARPPFQAASLTETIRQITSQEPVAPRQLNPSIDRDLETICLKCLQKEPLRRYASAEALADDLQRYLDGRPIVARPLGFVGRTWRWCRRNPASAGLISLAVTLAFVAIVAILVGYIETKSALAISDRRLMNAVSVVDDLFTRVSEDDLLDEPGMQPLRRDLLRRAKNHYDALRADASDDPRLRKDLALARYRVGVIAHFDEQYASALVELNEALRMQTELYRENPADKSFEKYLADTLNEMGSVYTDQAAARRDEEDNVGASAAVERAIASYLDAVRHRETLASVSRGQVDDQRKLANSLMNLGNAQRADAELRLSRELWASAAPGAEAAPDAEAAPGAEAAPDAKTAPGAEAAPDATSDSESGEQAPESSGEPLGPSEETLARIQEAHQNIRRAQEVRDDALRALGRQSIPMALKLRRDLAMGCFNLARVEVLGGSVSVARKSVAKAIEYFDTLRRDDPRSLAVMHLHAVALRFLGELEAPADPEQAWRRFEEAWRLSEPLARENPTVARYRMELASLARARGKLREAREQLAEAAAEWGLAAKTLRALVEDVERTRQVDQETSHASGPVVNDRELTTFRLARAEAVYALGDIADRLGQVDDARHSLNEARALLEDLLKTTPENQKQRREILRRQTLEVQELLRDLAGRSDGKTAPDKM